MSIPNPDMHQLDNHQVVRTTAPEKAAVETVIKLRDSTADKEGMNRQAGAARRKWNSSEWATPAP